MSKKIVLVKLTGIIFKDQASGTLSRVNVDFLAQQVKKISITHQCCFVIGGGNFFRGSEHNRELKLRPSIAHTVGMLGTMMNGLMLYDIFLSNNITTTLLCAVDCPLAGTPLCQQALDKALSLDNTVIISGGTGYPYVSTDTSAVIHAQQVGATQFWKATNVDGVYSADPHTDESARLLPSASYQHVLDARLGFMDRSALVLAQQASMVTRVFDIFAPDALVRAAHEEHFGTTLSN